MVQLIDPTQHRNEIRKALKAIQRKNKGLLRRRDVEQAARSPESPLHSEFTWDDSAAALKWRLEEAGQLIRSVKLVAADDSGPAFPMYVSLMPDRNRPAGGYRELNEVMSTHSLTVSLLETALAELESWRRRHERFAELVRIDDDDARRTLDAEKRKAKRKRRSA